jgi:hypothetical protein
VRILGDNLTKWFDFKEIGSYKVRGSYRMEFIDPGTETFYTVWEDYACAEFTVEIRDHQR